MLVQAGGQRERVLHGELGARADREVGGVGGIAEQHHVAVVPRVVAHGVEVEPLGVVGEDLVAPQLVGEDLGDPLDGVVVRDTGREALGLGAVEAGATPHVLVHLDDEGRARVGVGVAVDLHGAELGLLDEELERLEDQVGAEPDVLVVPAVERGPEPVGVRGADLGAEAVGGEDQVVRRPQLVGVGRLGAVVHGDAQLGDPLLEDLQQLLARHRGEALAADGERVRGPCGVGERHVDVGPAGEALLHPLVHHPVGALDAPEGLVGEDHAEAERVVGGVALPDGDVVGGVEALHEGGEVEASGPAARDRDPHADPSGRSASIIWRSLKCCSFPLVLRGIASTKRTARGYL